MNPCIWKKEMLYRKMKDSAGEAGRRPKGKRAYFIFRGSGGH